ncbi:hypothetical protein EG329_004490 [Mollisiaceae sp. DMI_Dod_QoI]|nr:hypothetical protein EG329_004490 [Helotiales sp. DMI_Dod_QoI]
MKLSCLSLVLLAQWTTASVIKRDGGAANYTGTPCAIVSQIAAAVRSTAAATTPTVDAQTAYDCLVSTPLNAEAGIALVNSILPYVEWQSDISYLKAPPSGYLMPAVDIRGALNKIITNLQAAYYATEHAFQTDLLKTFQSVHDGHFRFAPDLVSKAVQFRRPLQIVSVSRDGVEVPKVYTRRDISTHVEANSTVMPSEITKVNGQNVTAFLEDLAQLGFLQDPDALYNNLFYEKAFDAQYAYTRYTGYFALAGRMGYFYPGPNTTIEFANGTVNTYQNYADIVGNFNGVVNGTTMYQKFCTGSRQSAVQYDKNMAADVPQAPPLPPKGKTAPYGYPTPDVVSSDQQISGYFLNGSEYSDVAVLSMVSFEPNFPVEFQSVIQTLISDAKAAGKTKMIIDLSSNGGGYILTGYDAFRQFFPNITQAGYSRLRKHDAFKIMSKQISKYAANFTTDSNNAKDYLTYESVLNYRYDLNLTNGSFLTYDDKFASTGFNGDEFTQLMRWNLDDPTTTTNPVWGLGETVTGYGDRQNFTQPFAPENIILLYDGYCASTCTLFGEFMRTQGGVKSIAMGGRPNTSPIQGIGGTKGANNYAFSYVYQLATIALAEGTPEEVANWTSVQALSDLPMNRSVDASLNVRDHILPGNQKDGIPAQFINEPADCRLFYEPSMIEDVNAIWKKAADAAWGSAKCVAGSIPHKVETRAERMRRSEEMKVRAKIEGSIPVRPRSADVMMLREIISSHGKKVPL